MNTYKTHGLFFMDHLSRFYGEGIWSDYDMTNARWKGRHVHVTLTDEQFDELLRDAEFYASGGGGLDPEYAGLIKSAQFTVRFLIERREIISMNEYRAMGRYVRATDPERFESVCSFIGSTHLGKVGQYVEAVDPDMFENVSGAMLNA